MKAFFQNLNFARALILVSIVGCAVLGYLCYLRSTELTELKDDLDRKMVPTVTTLMQTAQRHTQLSQLVKGEGLKAEDDLVSYIRKVGAKDNVEIGELNLTSNESAVTGGIIDKKYTIKPDNIQASFKRLTLVNFLFSLEDDSRRVKLTRVKLEVADQKGLKPHEVPKDDWRFDCELTSRQRKASTP